MRICHENISTAILLLIEEVPLLTELRHEKTRFLPMQKTKVQISFAVTAKLISAFVFAIRIVQSLFNPNFQASRFFLWLYRPELVGNPEDQFSRVAAQLVV